MSQPLPPERFLRVASLIALVMVTTLMTMSSAGASAGPTLRLVSESGYTISVEGLNWPPGREVAFSVAQGNVVEGLAVRPAANGTFTVGVTTIDLCAGERFTARDLMGHKATQLGPGLMCPVSSIRLHQP